ncbi:MAG: hypothetical protein ABI429_00520 [Jatrophihabitantaceae bacterium]
MTSLIEVALRSIRDHGATLIMSPNPFGEGMIIGRADVSAGGTGPVNGLINTELWLRINHNPVLIIEGFRTDRPRVGVS